MSYASATGAQRLAVNSAAERLATGTSPARENTAGLGQRNDADPEALGLSMSQALLAVGISGIGTNQVTLTSGQKVNAVSVTGTGNFATFTIVGGAITAIVLSSS